MIGALTGMFLAIYLSITKLRRRYSSFVYTIWYLFSLTFCSTLLVAWWAVTTGAIDKQGKPQGTAGEVIMWLLNFMMDLKGSLIFTAGAVSLLIIPQFMAYILSGIFGCASTVTLVRYAMMCTLWFIVKSFAVASSISFAFGPVMLWLDRDLYDYKLIAKLYIIGISLIMLSFAFLMMYYDEEYIDGLLQFMQRRFPVLSNYLMRVHNVATKYRQNYPTAGQPEM